MSELLDIAHSVVKRAQTLGASEATAMLSQGSHVAITRRGGKVEQATEATTRRLVISLLVDDRYSSHSTSDLRSEAVETFLARAIAATRYLEKDPDRALPPAEECGRGVSEETLDQLDPAFDTYDADQRAALALRLENAMDGLTTDQFISSSVYTADGSSRGARVTSNGFADQSEGAWFSLGAELTLSDQDDKRPEASAFYGARYLSDLPSPEAVAGETVRRANQALGAGPIASGRYPMILINRRTPRVLGMLSGPISGGSIHQGRSVLADKLGEQIGSSPLTLRDEPGIPRGLGSAPWDGDGRIAKPRTIIENGVLRSFYIDTYYSRKLNMERTAAGSSNWVIPPGERHWREIARDFPKAILVTGFLGGNSNGVTGDFSFGIRGVLLENGEPAQTLAEMNISGNLLSIFHQLIEVDNDPWTWSTVRSPSLVFDDVSFSGT
jgi:PmbA protein